MKRVDRLKLAQALIKDPKNWTREEYARDERGKRVGAKSKRAVCWCAQGALKRFSVDETILNPAIKELSGKLIFNAHALNDGHVRLADGSSGHPAIMKAFDRTIALAEAEECVR